VAESGRVTEVQFFTSGAIAEEAKSGGGGVGARGDTTGMLALQTLEKSKPGREEKCSKGVSQRPKLGRLKGKNLQKKALRTRCGRGWGGCLGQAKQFWRER